MKGMKTSRDYIKDDLDLLEASTSFIKGDGYKEKILEDIEEFAGDGLTDYQKGLVREMAKCDYECGGCVDPYDESFKELLWEDEDLCDNMEEAQDYYQELADMGPAGFYEEFQDEFDWDPDFVAQYGDDYEEDDGYGEEYEEDDCLESHNPKGKRVKESTDYHSYDLTMREEAEMDEAYEEWYEGEDEKYNGTHNDIYLADASAFKAGYRANHDDDSTEDELEALACSYFDMMDGETTHHGSWCAGWRAISIHPENEKKEFDPYEDNDLGDLEDGPCGALADDENSAYYTGSYDYGDGGYDDYYESRKPKNKRIGESFDDEEYWNPNEVTTKIEFSKPETEENGGMVATFIDVLISDLSNGESKKITIEYDKSKYGLTTLVYDSGFNINAEISLDKGLDTAERTDWVTENLPILIKELQYSKTLSKMLSKDLSEKLAYTILDNATSLAVGNSIDMKNLQEAAGNKKGKSLKEYNCKDDPDLPKIKGGEKFTDENAVYDLADKLIGDFDEDNGCYKLNGFDVFISTDVEGCVIAHVEVVKDGEVVNEFNAKNGMQFRYGLGLAAQYNGKESRKRNKKSIKEKRITSAKTPTEWFKLFNNIFLEIKDKFPNLGVSKDWDGKFPAKIFIDKLDLELQFDLNYNGGYYSGSMRTYFGKNAYDGDGEPLVAWNSGDYEEFEADVQDAIDYLTGVCESRGSKIGESKKKGKKSIKENASDMDVYIVTPDWDQYPCDEHGNPDGWDPREEAEYFTKLENAALACGMQTGFIPFSDGDAESGMCAPETDGTWQATPAMLRQFIEEYDLPIKVYEQGVDGEVGEEIFDYQSLAFDADPIEQDGEVRDMGEMYGVPRGASSEEALKFFESKKRIKEMNTGMACLVMKSPEGKLYSLTKRGTCEKKGDPLYGHECLIRRPVYVLTQKGDKEELSKAKKELDKRIKATTSSVDSLLKQGWKFAYATDEEVEDKYVPNKNI